MSKKYFFNGKARFYSVNNNQYFLILTRKNSPNYFILNKTASIILKGVVKNGISKTKKILSRKFDISASKLDKDFMNFIKKALSLKILIKS
ncbi:MAG: hypothetical protein QW471_01750 [Candidatus Woesearchaeota archaeon]